MDESIRLMIADDEPRIVQLINMLGHWEEQGIEVVESCYSGKTAYDYILSHRPDIVITDIQMPGCNGLELIEKVREAGIVDTAFIVLSGYKYFDYARNAISLGVIDYLVKPIDEEQLNEILGKACDQVRKQRRQRSDSSRLEQLITEEKAQRDEVFWRNLLTAAENGQIFVDAGELETVYHIRLSRKPVVGLITIECVDQASLPAVFYDRIQKIITDTIGERFPWWSSAQQEQVWVLMDMDPENYARRRRLFQMIHTRTRELMVSYGTFRVTTSYSAEIRHTELLARGVTEAESAAFGRFLYPSAEILDGEMFLECPRFRNEEMISGTELHQFEESIVYCRVQDFENLTGLILQRSQQFEKYHPEDMLRMIHLLDRVFQAKMAPETAFHASRGLFLNCRDYSSCLQALFQHMIIPLRKRQEEISQKSRKPVEDAKYYVEEHFAEAISQENVADYVGLSSVYLSRTFKAETGVGFNDYLTNVRLTHARKMLTDTTLSVAQIAEMVGYGDSGYFSRIFKKKFGVKPGEFRTMFSRQK